MNITVLEELKAYIDPLTPDEHQALERSILSEGCRDALVLWGDILVDGHNRYGICQKHGLAFNTVQNTRFKSMEDVHLWMIDQHLGRRSVSDFQRGVLALRKKEITTARAQAAVAALAEAGTAIGAATGTEFPNEISHNADIPAPEPLISREAIAKAARISSNTVVQIEKIQKNAAPELVEAVKAGTISINAAAAVASLEKEDQRAAVAGGKKELQQAAKRVRESKSRSPKSNTGTAGDENSEATVASEDSISAEERNREAQLTLLQNTVAELSAENKALKEENQALLEQLAALQSQA
ncbi:plasmid replication/partition related protein [Roseateles sp.]|uniref:plasmid replication/partition related protein n=1 Tax=Roseateles sp. TaxID=1971397 RepID=UPI003BA66B39